MFPFVSVCPVFRCFFLSLFSKILNKDIYILILSLILLEKYKHQSRKTKNEFGDMEPVAFIMFKESEVGNIFQIPLFV